MANVRGVDIQFKAILPEQMRDVEFFIAAMAQEVVSNLEDGEKLFDGATATWKEQPKWNIRIKPRKNDLVGRLYTQSHPFTWVELGTKVRWRMMSSDFTAKSEPGSLIARPGSGKATGFFRGQPKRPGIRARDFRVEVARLLQPRFERKVTTRMASEASRLFIPGTSVRR